MDELMVCANFAAAAVMTGVIWTVQLVHYPLLASVPVDDAVDVAVRHQRSISWVVGPPMAVEGAATLWLLLSRPESVGWWLPWVSAILLAVVLGCTVLLSVPLHAQMASTPKSDTGRRLVVTNWPRTAGWTLRLIIGLIMLTNLI